MNGASTGTTATGVLSDRARAEPAGALRRGWRRVLRQPVSVLGGAIVLVFVASALGAPWIAPTDPAATDWSPAHGVVPPSPAGAGTTVPRRRSRRPWPLSSVSHRWTVSGAACSSAARRRSGTAGGRGGDAAAANSGSPS